MSAAVAIPIALYRNHPSYLILGGTGTLGHAMIEALPKDSYIRVVSRDELKLSELKRKFPHVETFVGDIRDKTSVAARFKNIDVCFHFAALKRIPEMEAQPIESMKTNILGTINAAELAIAYGVKHFIFSSTDKACLPINSYGASKFLSEKILFSLNDFSQNPRERTNFSVYRWGNILGSRGSVLHSFKDSILNDKPAHITNEQMSRFWIKIEDAVQFVLSTYQQESNIPKIPQMKSAKVTEVLSSIARVMKKDVPYAVTGMRPGEKIHEDISFINDTCQTLNSNNADRFTPEELDALLRTII